MRHVLQGAISLLFPTECAGCAAPLEGTGKLPVCPDCLNRLPRSQPPHCRRCALSLSGLGAGVVLCLSCRTSPPAFDRAVSPFLYTEPIRELITALKYAQRISLASFLGEAMAQTVRTQIGEVALTALVPVPLHPVRFRERSFNQAELLADSLANHLGLPCLDRLLIRRRSTTAQTELPRQQRLANVRDAFDLEPDAQPPSGAILLVDDVLTTGATVHACAARLKKAGVPQVYVVTAARG